MRNAGVTLQRSARNANVALAHLMITGVVCQRQAHDLYQAYFYYGEHSLKLVHGMRRISLRLRSLDPQLLLRRVRRCRLHSGVSSPSAYSVSSKDKERLLKGVSVDNRQDVIRILEQAQKADATWSTVCTDFYTPPVISDAMSVVRQLPGVACTSWGGYQQAERTRLVLAKEEMLDTQDAQVCNHAHDELVCRICSAMHLPGHLGVSAEANRRSSSIGTHVLQCR